MAIQTFRSRRSLSISGVTVGGTDVTGTHNAGYTYQQTIPGGSVNVEVDIPVDVSTVKAMGISSNVAITIKTNSTGAPDDTIAVAAGAEKIWIDGVDDVAEQFITVDVTKFYISVPGADSANVTMAFAVDSTPVLAG